MDKLSFLVDKVLSRRGFLAGAGSVAAASALAGCSDDGSVPNPVSPTLPAVTDADILNYALNLEYLEASFYLYAATGSGLAASDMTAGSSSPYVTPGTVTVNSTVTKVAGTTAAQQAIINEIAFEEQEHVRFLRAALGANAVPMPNLDLTFFAPLATNLSPAISGFSPFASFDAFLIGAYIFEDVGVTAYLGAAPLISAAGVTSGYLTAASGILAVEAYHAAYIRASLTGRAVAAGATSPTDAKYPYVGIANEVASLRASLTVGNSGSPITPAQVVAGTSVGNTGVAGSASSVEVALSVPTNTTTPATVTTADPATAIAFARTANQVHHIVYGSATVGVNKGGFFPSGTNSRFSTTTA